jgi:type IV secretory pathway TrbD component
MSNMPQFHTVHRSINRLLTIWGAERRLFFLALIMGGAAFNFFGSLTSGLFLFAVLTLSARWATRTDPQILRILLNSSKFRRRYDPAKLQPLQGATRD